MTPEIEKLKLKQEYEIFLASLIQILEQQKIDGLFDIHEIDITIKTIKRIIHDL